jgi:two-component system sensor histidine kinase PilS (NtrC family)
VNETPLEILDRPKWLLRLIYIRFVVFSLFIPISLWIDTNKPLQLQIERLEDMKVLLAVVAGLTVFWWTLLKVNRWYVAQAYGQIALDLLLITWTVNRTGGVDSFFPTLYFLEIIFATILLESRGAFFAATFSSVLHFGHLDLAYFQFVPSINAGPYPLPALQFIIALNIFGFCSVSYLSNRVTESWRRTGVALQKSTGQVAFLQAFSDKIVDSMGSGLVTTDIDGRIYLFNRSASLLTGRSAREAASMKIWDAFPGLRAEAKNRRSDVWTKRKDGKDIYVRFSVSPIMIDDKDTAGHVWCFDDLTEIRLLERQVRQKEQMAAIGAMSAGIAHEIRNPLASITGSFKLLHSDLQLNESQIQLADIISRETERLNRTISGFLSFARPPAPKLKMTDLAVIVTEMVSLMRNSPELSSHHSIEMRLESVHAMVDESMMRQVFYNIATNAFKAMPDGGTLTISVEPRNGAQVRFHDTGIGLDEAEMKNLFVPFCSSFSNGTGLGMAIVYQIVSAHNGVIGVKSRKGAGSTFFVDLKK